MLYKLYKILFLLAYIFLAYANALANITEKQTEPSQKYKTKNIIIVDMGSTGTRMHAYNIQTSPKQAYNDIPFLTEIGMAKSIDKQAVANYCDKPKNISEHILPLYYDLTKQLKNLDIDVKQIPIYFYATAGMRLKPQKQQELVYKELIKSMELTGHENKMITTKTIPGELEGVFDWLSVNYKLQTIQNNEPTIAALDMGGASTQVAMEYNANQKQNNIYQLNFANKKYNIYSKSILGYGLTQTKKNITNYDHKQALAECQISQKNNDSKTSNNIIYTENYNKLDNATGHELGHDINPGHKNTAAKNLHEQIHSQENKFNYAKCGELIKLYLKNKKDHLGVAKAIKSAIKNNMRFVAASGYYYNFTFFNSKLPEDLIKSIPDSCHIHRAEFKSNFPSLSEEDLNEACFDATYLKILLNNGYKMPISYHNFAIPKHDIDWTIGAALFIATKQKWNNY